jgi:hypothetical protein
MRSNAPSALVGRAAKAAPEIKLALVSDGGCAKQHLMRGLIELG